MDGVMLKIISCDKGDKWYANLIGQTVPLLAVEKTEYKSRQPDGYINFVSKGDAIIVEVNNADS